MGSKGDKTREYIKEIAYPLFVQKGFKEVTMKDICERAGLSRGGLYRYFGSTAEIFEEIWKGLTGSTEEDFAKKMSEGQNAKEMLREILGNYKREIEEKEKTLTLAVYEYSHAVSNSFFIELNRTSKIKWSNFIQYGIERGEFQPVDVDAVVDLILYSYQGARMWSTILPVNQGISEHIVDCIWNILVPKERR